MLIVPAEAADVEAIADLVNGAYRGSTATAGWTHEADYLDGQRTNPASLRDMLDAGVHILVARAEPGGSLLGCVSLDPKGSEPGSWSIGMLTVTPQRQGGGFGSVLLAAAERHARQHGALRTEMTVIGLRTSLIAFYRRRGYQPTGETRPFPYDDERFGRPRRADLEFVVLAKAEATDAGRSGGPKDGADGLSPE